MTADTLMRSNNNSSWPALGRPLPPPLDPPALHAPHPEWEMVADAAPRGRPRSATMAGGGGGGGAVVDALPRRCPVRRTLRRCASTPDMVVGDGAHEMIVEEESDDPSGDEPELIEPADESDESFEVLSDENSDAADGAGEEEPILVERGEGEGEEKEEEAATLVSTPSIGTASWTLTSAAAPAAGAWGSSPGPSFKDMLAKNIDDDEGAWGRDKARTEARLRDSHRRHHLRVRTKPRFVVADARGRPQGGPGRGLTHAHSTGDLSTILRAVEGGHESGGGRGHHHGQRTRGTPQLSAMTEEEEDGDYVIGRGAGGGGGDGAGVLGDTDAADYYGRKEHGNRCASNKKKERPDEAKRREIILYKKEAQRKKQQQSQGGGGGEDKKKNTKHDKGFGGKKERRRF